MTSTCPPGRAAIPVSGPDAPRSMWGLVLARAERTPDAPMLLDHRDRRVTFAEFRDLAERTADRLAERGVGPGTPVSWQLPTTIETVVVSMALTRLGAVQNPIIPVYRERELRTILAEHDPALVLSGTAAAGPTPITHAAAGLAEPPPVVDVATLVPTIGSEPDLVEERADRVEVRRRPDPAELDRAAGDPTWLYHTSGTTSAPKGVCHSDATLLAGARALVDALEVRPDDVGSIAFPYAHIGGPDYLGLVLHAGIPVVLLEAFRVDEAVAVFRRHGVTIAGGSTVFYAAFLEAQRARPDEPLLPTLRVLAGGGAPKPARLFHEVRHELGVPIVHGWAMTECPMACMGRRGAADDLLAETEGRPVLGLELKVVDDAGREVAPGEPGELLVRGPMLFHGYADAALDAEAFDGDGYYRSGDLGLVRDDGHLVITGRRKDVIIRKGENVSAREVEDLLYEHPDVREVAVVGLPDEARGERVCAVVALHDPAVPFTLGVVQAHCREGALAVHKTPEQVEVVADLPRNATGKVAKEVLRERFGAGPPGAAGRAATVGR